MRPTISEILSMAVSSGEIVGQLSVECSFTMLNFWGTFTVPNVLRDAFIKKSDDL